MQHVTVHKEYGEQVLASLAAGEPIEPQTTGGYSGEDLLMIAGACFWAIMAKGPLLPQPDLTLEQVFADAVEHLGELTTAVMFVSNVFDKINRGAYDQEWEPTMRCIVTGEGHEAEFEHVEGWKVDQE